MEFYGAGQGLAQAPRVRDRVRKFFPSCGVEQEWGKKKPCKAGVKITSFDPTPPPLPSLWPTIISSTTVLNKKGKL